MKNSTSMPFEYDDANQKKLKEIWGDSLKKLTPKQRQLVVKILINPLASACSTTRVTITRLLGKLQEQGKITLDSKKYIILKEFF